MRKKQILIIATIIALAFGKSVFAQEPHPHLLHEQQYTEEQIAAFLQANIPETWDELQEIKQRDPLFYPHLLNDIKFKMFRYNELQNADPDMAAEFLKAERLEAGSRALARKLQQTDDQDARAEIKKKLELMLGEIFELRMAEREAEVKKLEKELDDIRNMLQTRRQSRDQIIDRRLRELADERDEATAWW